MSLRKYPSNRKVKTAPINKNYLIVEKIWISISVQPFLTKPYNHRRKTDYQRLPIFEELQELLKIRSEVNLETHSSFKLKLRIFRVRLHPLMKVPRSTK